MRPFDFIIIGGGTFGAAMAEHLWFRSTGRSERILVLEAGPFLLPEHMQLPNPLPSTPAGRKKLETDLRNKLKLEAPLAVQARPEHADFFPLNKFSSVPLLIKAARTAFSELGFDNDAHKRLMVVPRCHVTRLSVASDPDGRRADAVLTERGPIPVSPDCKVIVALGTIESTRLAQRSSRSHTPAGSSPILWPAGSAVRPGSPPRSSCSAA